MLCARSLIGLGRQRARISLITFLVAMPLIFCRREQPFTLHIIRQFHVTIEEMRQYRREET